MKTMIIFSILFISGIAQAQDTYSILGKGIQDRKTGDTIALTCVEKEAESQECSAISFVRFSATTNETTEIGQRFKIQNDDLDAASRTAAKDLKKKIKKSYKAHFKPNTAVGLISYVGLFAGGLGLTVAFNTFIPGLAVTGLWVYMYYKDLDPSFMDPRGYIVTAFLTVKNNQLGQAVRDQNGWNWSVAPKQVFHKRFEKIAAAIEQQ